jgi:hypothetical protein
VAEDRAGSGPRAGGLAREGACGQFFSAAVEGGRVCRVARKQNSHLTAAVLRCSNTSQSAQGAQNPLRAGGAPSSGVAGADCEAAGFTRRVVRVAPRATEASCGQLLQVAIINDLRCFIRLNVVHSIRPCPLGLCPAPKRNSYTTTLRVEELASQSRGKNVLAGLPGSAKHARLMNLDSGWAGAGH